MHVKYLPICTRMSSDSHTSAQITNYCNPSSIKYFSFHIWQHWKIFLSGRHTACDL